MWSTLLTALALAQPVSSRLEEAQTLIADGRAEEARPALVALLGEVLDDDARGDALYWLAEVDAIGGDFPNALAGTEAARAAHRQAGAWADLASDWLLSSLVAQGQQDADAALHYAQQGRQEVLATLGADSPGAAELVQQLAEMHAWRGEYEQAASAAEEAIALVAPMADEVPETWEDLLAKAGRFQFFAGDYARAVAHYRSFQDAVEARTPPGHVERVLPLELVGTALMYLGSFAEAETLLRQALALSEAVGQTPVERITLLSNLSSLHKRQGRYGEAARSMRQAVTAARSEQETTWMPVLLSNLGALQLEMSDEAGALVTLQEALAAGEALWGPDHPRLANTLGNLGVALEAAGDFVGAMAATERMLELQQATLPVGHPSLATGWTNLATMALRAGFLEEAEAALAAAAVHLDALPEHHPERAWWAETQAELAYHREDPETEQTWRERAVVDRTAYHGPDHPITLKARLLEAATARGRGDTEAARAGADAVLRATSRLTDELLTALGEVERIAWAADRRRALDFWLQVHPEAVEEAWMHVLGWKGLSLRAGLAQQRAARDNSDPEVQATALAFDEARRELAEATLASADGDVEGQRIQVAALSARVTELETQLGGVQTHWRNTTPTTRELCAALGSTGALVDIWRRGEAVPYGEPARFEAFVLHGGRCELQRVDLGLAAELEQVVRRWRRLLARPATRLLDEGARQVRRRVWDPLLPALGESTHVVVIPDGVLSQVAWATLPLEDGSYLLQQRAVDVAAQAGDLLPMPGVATAGRGALVVSAVDYGTEGRGGQHRGLRACLGEGFAPLPGTRAEGRLVARRLRQRGVPTEVLTGTEATEVAVVERVEGRRVLHLATHGYFTGGDCKESEGTGVRSAGLRTGLVLAGANGRDQAGDGLWTAAEVATLDLAGTELVVLSACETGLGDVVAGEGVLGLQRAFAQAGAQNVVMSLWAVEDEATKALMARFYRHLRTAADPAAALRRAQLQQLAANELTGNSRPWTWGAFVLAHREGPALASP